MKKVRLSLFLALFMIFALGAGPALADLTIADDNIVFVAPAAGESLAGSASYTVKWQYPEAKSFILSFSSDGGANYSDVATVAGSAGDSSYVWTVPSVDSSQCKLKLTWDSKTLWPAPITTHHFKESQAFTINKLSVLPLNPGLHFDLSPAAPDTLTATASSSSEIKLTWKDKSSNETGFKVERKSSGDFAEVATVAADATAFKDLGLTAGTTYTYRVKATNSFGNSAYSNEASAKTNAINLKPLLPDIPIKPLLPGTTTEIRFYVGSTDYYVNSQIQSMDAAPQIMEGRTILPIRYVAQPLGATVNWNPDDQKVTITFNSKQIDMFINSNTAIVDGVPQYIDPDNQNVTPIIVDPGRTMLPLRFIAEQLGCKVDWAPSTQEVKITYPKA